MASGSSLKDELFNVESVGYLAGRFRDTGAVDADRFEAAVMERLTQLELKARITWIADCLCAVLPETLPEAAPILRAALPEPLDPTKTDNDFGRFIIAPLGEVVVSLGLEDHPGLSLDLLEEITQRFSMEWAIRPFLARWPDMVMDRLGDWAGHPNYHVRRLVSEGTRPKLPWAQAIPLPPDRALPLLDRLHADPTRYVTRSVANHLNDVTKIDAALAFDRIEAWHARNTQAQKELEWMTAHALRGLVKAGDPCAMALIGFDPDAAITVQDFHVPATARIGETIEISATLAAAEETGALVDYIFWRTRSNGQLAPKVHKMKKLRLTPGTPVTVAKRHLLKGDATTYRLYPGPHRISLQVNGRVLGEADFDLRAS